MEVDITHDVQFEDERFKDIVDLETFLEGLYSRYADDVVLDDQYLWFTSLNVVQVAEIQAYVEEYLDTM